MRNLKLDPNVSCLPTKIVHNYKNGLAKHTCRLLWDVFIFRSNTESRAGSRLEGFSAERLLYLTSFKLLREKESWKTEKLEIEF